MNRVCLYSAVKKYDQISPDFKVKEEVLLLAPHEHMRGNGDFPTSLAFQHNTCKQIGNYYSKFYITYHYVFYEQSLPFYSPSAEQTL